MRAHPEVNAMYESGTVSELAMRTIFASGLEKLIFEVAWRGAHPSPKLTSPFHEYGTASLQSGRPRRMGWQARGSAGVTSFPIQ